MTPRHVYTSIFLATSLLSVACNADPTTAAVRGDVTQRASNEHAPIGMVVGQTRQLADLLSRPARQWRSSDTSVASISGDGVLVAKMAGVARITASTYLGDTTINLSVQAAPDSAAVHRHEVVLEVGDTARIHFRNYPSPTARRENPADVQWTSTSPAVADVDVTGLVSGRAPGCAMILATRQGQTDSALVHIVDRGADRGNGVERCHAEAAQTAAGIRWMSNFASRVTVGGTAQISAAAVDSAGTQIAGKAIAYASSKPEVATISATGLLTALTVGATDITASVDGKEISTQISVDAKPEGGVPKVARIVVHMTREMVPVGDSSNASAAAFDSAGTQLHGVSVAWSLRGASSGAATINESGALKTFAPGIVEVVAGADGVTGKTNVTVVSPSTTIPSPGSEAPAGAAAVLALVGPTIPVANVPTELKWYESRFQANANAQWAAFGSRWDAGNSNAGYDRAATYYTWWARTGDSTYLRRAHETAVAYRDNYLVPAGFGSSPHWSQVEGLYLDWVVSHDAASRDAVLSVANRFVGFDPSLDDKNKDWLENRVQARVLLSFWMAEKIEGPGSAWAQRLTAAIPRILAMQSPDGHWGFVSTCGGSWNFMTGMLADLLSRMYDQRPGNAAQNPAILAALSKAATYLWTTQWRSADRTFNYASLECLNAGGPTTAPDLNGLILPLYGWLGRTTGDRSWFDKGDLILAGMQGADVELYKQFSESYSSSFRYLGYRYGP